MKDGGREGERERETLPFPLAPLFRVITFAYEISPLLQPLIADEGFSYVELLCATCLYLRTRQENVTGSKRLKKFACNRLKSKQVTVAHFSRGLPSRTLCGSVICYLSKAEFGNLKNTQGRTSDDRRTISIDRILSSPSKFR